MDAGSDRLHLAADINGSTLHVHSQMVTCCTADDQRARLHPKAGLLPNVSKGDDLGTVQAGPAASSRRTMDGNPTSAAKATQAGSGVPLNHDVARLDRLATTCINIAIDIDLGIFHPDKAIVTKGPANDQVGATFESTSEKIHPFGIFQ